MEGGQGRSWLTDPVHMVKGWDSGQRDPEPRAAWQPSVLDRLTYVTQTMEEHFGRK